eukprot:2957565-Pleurochrysis_carterae.AAC.1
MFASTRRRKARQALPRAAGRLRGRAGALVSLVGALGRFANSARARARIHPRTCPYSLTRRRASACA